MKYTWGACEKLLAFGDWLNIMQKCQILSTGECNTKLGNILDSLTDRTSKQNLVNFFQIFFFLKWLDQLLIRIFSSE